MRIRSHIFISVFIATVLPLVSLALAATYFAENNYQQDIDREIHTSLNSVTNEISRQLQNNRNLVLGISQATAVQSLLPILKSASEGETHPAIHLLRNRVNRYFSGFQTIIPDSFNIRILDYRGDTLVKVSHQKVSDAVYESLSGIEYVEHQISSQEFVDELRKLPRDEISMVTLPHHQAQNEIISELSLLDYAVPLYEDNTWLGTLIVTLSGKQMDYIADNVPRLYKGQLLIIENNPDDASRHGLLLYDEKNKFNLAQIRTKTHKLDDYYSLPVFDKTVNQPEGMLEGKLKQTYYNEFFPYPNRLIGWIIATRIDKKLLSAPFQQIRLAIWLFAAASLLITLALTGLAVRKISQPVCALASQLKSFADGNQQQRAQIDQSIAEIHVLGSAFNYMADTLLKAQDDRDNAQNMMIQSSKLASIGEMAAGIGHEINNPLNNILSYTKLISRNIAKNASDVDSKTLQDLQSDLDSLRDETLRASEIIKGILNFARQMPPNYSSFPVKEWLEKSIALVQQTARAKHVDIKLNYHGEVLIEGDQPQLQQVIINLLLNAIQASDSNTEINIDVKAEQDRIDIKVRDQGSGIEESELAKIYDPFFTTKPEGEGSGLGLSISLGIIEVHQGSIVIQNNADKGITATIMLPLKDERYNHIQEKEG